MHSHRPSSGPTRVALALAALLFVGLAPATGQFLVVDASGGGDFLTIQPAVDAALPGEVVLVRGGVYPSFVLDKPISVLAEAVAPGANSVVAGPVLVRDIPAGTRAGLAGLFVEKLFFQDSAGTVLCDALGIAPSSVSAGPGDDYAIEVVDCADVRWRQVGLNPGNGSGRGGVLVVRSRLEMDGAAIDGARGIAGVAGQPTGGDGGHGIVCTDGSLVHVANSRVRGGQGGPALFSPGPGLWDGGTGGDAIVVESGASLVANGTIEMELFGGWAGKGSINGQLGCPLEGPAGTAVHVMTGGTARVSATIEIEGGFSSCGNDGPPTVVEGSLAVSASPSFPLGL